MHTISGNVHAAAVRATVGLVDQATVADLTRPTPCAGWDLGDLLAHMTAQHRGFAAAVHGHGRDPAVWEPVRPGDDFREEYAEAAATVVEAFAAPGALAREVQLPELSADRTFPGRLALSFHLVDYVVHGWDVATTLSLPFDLPDDVLAAALPIARAVPDGEARLSPGAAFAPARAVPPGAGPLAEVLLRLGRQP
ncbi:TIGR03086 family protein [Actinoplanes cyaneus]|uniref:TIGR03086 family protein n=1 Tax=Actinoplanes cyaneus TaxID=52696 RepID=A0A919IPW4_9ACTN|nr:TIGR03086 family metal-binding protein [Actinoplanes cyaneus]MCW2142818.1 TIGR03086 family protein [Actinoplanes cyaneus]GID68786.1 TIGR03086 family protein [Actinoplanes cyaneus]